MGTLFKSKIKYDIKIIKIKTVIKIWTIIKRIRRTAWKIWWNKKRIDVKI